MKKEEERRRKLEEEYRRQIERDEKRKLAGEEIARFQERVSICRHYSAVGCYEICPFFVCFYFL